MTTTAAKLWFAVTGLAAVAAFVYILASDGEWYGSAILGTLALAAALLGTLAVAVRDGDVAVSDTTAAEVPVARNSLPSGWPALAAVGAGVTIVGLAGKNALLWVGIGIIGAVFVEWMVQGWAERATVDPAYNQALRKRIMSPIEIPVLAATVIAGFLLSLSRVLLALPENGSRIVAILVASAILGVAFLIAYRPRIASSVLAGVLGLGAVALIAAGIAGGVHGERTIEKNAGVSSSTTTSTSTSTSTP